MKLVIEQRRARFLEQQDQCERQKHLIEMVPLPEFSKQAAFKDRAKDRTAENSGKWSQPKLARRFRDNESHISANHEQAAMREVNHPHDAKDQGQSAADQKQQQPIL